jgi:hypothetical protein
MITSNDMESACQAQLQANGDLQTLFGAGFEINLDDTQGANLGDGLWQICLMTVSEDSELETLGMQSFRERRGTLMALIVYYGASKRSALARRAVSNASARLRNALLLNRAYSPLWWGLDFPENKTTQYFYQAPKYISLTFFRLESTILQPAQ